MRNVFVTVILLAACGGAGAEEPLPTVVLKPEMRIVDRDWNYFSTLPCDRIYEEKARSAAEQSLLQRRKQACLERYRAFSPQSGVR